MNKREARFIMQLPDGYEYSFMNNGEYIIGAAPDKPVIGYRILENGAVEKIEIRFEPDFVRVEHESTV